MYADGVRPINGLVMVVVCSLKDGCDAVCRGDACCRIMACAFASSVISNTDVRKTVGRKFRGTRCGLSVGERMVAWLVCVRVIDFFAFSTKRFVVNGV